MGFGSFVNKAIGVVNPVSSIVKKVTGMDPTQQMLFAAGAGGAAKGLAGGSGGLGGIFSKLGPSLISGGADYLASREQAKAQKDANLMNLGIAREQMAFSSAQAQREMDFQERMSNSSYQRAVDDMRKAGINPMLAYDKGGASTPGGASGSPAGAHMEAIEAPMTRMVNSAREALRFKRELNILDKEAAFLDSRIANMDMDTTIKVQDEPSRRTSGRIHRNIHKMLDYLGLKWKDLSEREKNKDDEKSNYLEILKKRDSRPSSSRTLHW